MATSRNDSVLSHVDWLTIALFAGLCIFGWMNVYGASYTFDQTSVLDFSYRSGKQAVWIATAWLLGLFILLLDTKVIDRPVYILYGLMLLILLATPFLAHDTKGSMSWISLGPVKIQPAEFAKCITALTLARFMSRYDYHIRSWRDLIVPFILLGVPAAIVMIWQDETGSALVFASFLLMFYRQGMSGVILVLGVVAVLLFVITIKFGIIPTLVIVAVVTLIALARSLWKRFRRKREWRLWHIFLILGCAVASIGFSYVCRFAFDKVLQAHQRSRIEVLLGLKDDPQGAGYNVTQSLIAIGSGGFVGKGFLNGTQTKMNFVPEQATDFIFCTVGEEWGFLGSTALLLVYTFFILRLIYLCERQKELFSQIYGYCVVGIFIFHVFINIGMVLGLLPVIGIPLPFISYGGSGMWGFTLLLFLFLRLDAARVEKM